MKIETKFDIGQEVWLKYQSYDVNGVVTEIHAYFTRTRQWTAYMVEAKNYVGVFSACEDEIFLTKEELLKSL